MRHRIKEKYHLLFEEQLHNEIIQTTTIRDFAEGDRLMEIGEYIKTIPFLLSGVIKIIREDQKEDENCALLY